MIKPEELKPDDKVLFIDGTRIVNGFVFAILHSGEIAHIKDTKGNDYVLPTKDLFWHYFDIYDAMHDAIQEMNKSNERAISIGEYFFEE
jgi:hypothetical protein